MSDDSIKSGDAIASRREREQRLGLVLVYSLLQGSVAVALALSIQLTVGHRPLEYAVARCLSFRGHGVVAAIAYAAMLVVDIYVSRGAQTKEVRTSAAVGIGISLLLLGWSMLSLV